MKLIENAIALVAPHRCVVCALEGELLCFACQQTNLIPVPSRCYRCHGLTRQHSVCRSCRSSVKINHAWVATQYEAVAKELLYKLKFARARAGAVAIARVIDSSLPDLPPEVIVCHIPTANHRVRTRGYDQAEEIAKSLCRLKGWKRKNLLVRTGRSRQVGSSRKERFKHLEKALMIRKNVDLKGEHVLLIDDVTTTGATIEAASKIIKSAGAKTVDAAVFAQP